MVVDETDVGTDGDENGGDIDEEGLGKSSDDEGTVLVNLIVKD